MEIEIFSSAELLGSAKLRSGRITARQPERVTGFFNAYRQGERVTRNRLRDRPAISELAQEPLREMEGAHSGCN